MPLPSPAVRTPMHTRRTTFRGFERSDGLWDIEGELLDTKPHAFEIEGERHWAADEPIHHMHIRLTLDNTMTIREVAVADRRELRTTIAHSLAMLQRLIGESIGRGWRQTIDRHLGGVQGCTHLRELLFGMATAAFQSRSASFATPTDGSPPMHLGKCLAWDFNGPVVERVYPVFFRWHPPAQP